jgi:uncharacterized membrane protein
MILAMLAAAAAKSAVLYTAAGTEPFWGLTIGRRTMLLDDESAERKIRAPTPRPKVTRLGATYATPAMTVRIRHEGCNDGMSEGVYADSVEVILKDMRFRGCGELIGRYRAANGRITSTAPLAPKGGCVHSAFERKAAAILAAPLSIRWNDKDDEAEVQSSRGVIRLRRRY